MSEVDYLSVRQWERDIIKCQGRRLRPTKSVMAAVAAIAVLAAMPAIGASVTSEAQAAATAKCRQGIERGPPYSEPICFDEQEVAEAEQEIAAAREAAEALAVRTKALGEPVQQLSVKIIGHPAQNCHPLACTAGHHPGYTTLKVTTAPFAYITIKLARYGQRTENYELGPESTHLTLTVPWSCSSPGGTYRYTVMAHSNVGPILVRRGSFRAVSIARCHELKRQEAESRARSEREYREGLTRSREAERARLKQWESNCRALGDAPAVLHIEGGIVHVCRTPEGYTIEVPE
jgi:hypothetical protein